MAIEALWIVLGVAYWGVGTWLAIRDLRRQPPEEDGGCFLHVLFFLPWLVAVLVLGIIQNGWRVSLRAWREPHPPQSRPSRPRRKELKLRREEATTRGRERQEGEAPEG